ncbi:hypothetical protein [Thalassospira mesophila]|nr:hypothetical protein [Thalassospira mesophila]
MAKGKNRQNREEKKPKQKKVEVAAVPSFNKGLTIATKPKTKKS